MNFNDLTKLPETLAAMEQRIETLEKEVADLKRQLKGQPNTSNHITILGSSNDIDGYISETIKKIKNLRM